MSIVIPAYNSERFLSATIDSALEQTFRSLEVIVVDDASTDDTFGVAQEFSRKDPRVRVLRQEQNGKLPRARNLGISALHSASQAVLFLDHDDLLERDAIEQLLGLLERHRACVAAYGLPRYIDAHGRHILPGEAETSSRTRYRLVPGGIELCAAEDPTTFEVLVISCCIHTPGQVLIRRKAVNQIGEFDPQLTYAADWDYWLRLSNRGELRILDHVVLGYRRHDASMSRQYRLLERDNAALLRKFRESSTLTTEQRAMMRQGRRWWCWLASRFWFRWAEESLRQGRYFQAANQLRHAVINRSQFYLGGFERANVVIGENTMSSNTGLLSQDRQGQDRALPAELRPPGVLRRVHTHLKTLCLDEWHAWQGYRALRPTLRKVRPLSMVFEPALRRLAQQVQIVLTEKIHGDFVECGVWRGGSAFLMADLLRRAGVHDRKVWLCDSFEGLPPPEAIDGPRALAYSQATNDAWYLDKCSASLEEVRHSAQMLGLTPYTEFVKGWFDQTLPEVRARIGPIALLRIDADWHASVRCCLETLYDQVVDGGFVILDDYCTYDGCAIAVHQFLGERQLSHRIMTEDGVAYFRKR